MKAFKSLYYTPGRREIVRNSSAARHDFLRAVAWHTSN